MRSLILIAGLGIMSLTDVGAAQASEGPWCLRTRDRESCGIANQQACMMEALPLNGSCWPNPNFRGAVATAPRQVRRTRRHDY